MIIVTADASNLERNLLLFTEIRDLGIPTVLALTMVDVANKNGLNIDISKLENEFSTKVVAINGRTGQGVEELKKVVANGCESCSELFYDVNELSPEIIPVIRDQFKLTNDYTAYQYAQQTYSKPFLSIDDKKFIADAKSQIQLLRSPVSDDRDCRTI